MPAMVLVVGRVRGLLEKGHNLYCRDRAREIIPGALTRLEVELAKRSKVFYICDTHRPDDLKFQMFPVHCVKGTGKSEAVPEMEPYQRERINKQRYSGFYDTNLEELAQGKIVICSVCTDICLLHTTADARNRDYRKDVPTDAVVTFDEEAHEWALQRTESILGARLITAQVRRPSLACL